MHFLLILKITLCATYTSACVISEYALSGCWIGVLERCSKPSKERLSVFLENVRQEMPKAHLELLHSGSLCVTAEAFSAALPACLLTNPLFSA